MFSFLRALERRPFIAIVTIVIATWIAYWPSFDGVFLFDDEYRILRDPRLETDSWTDHLTARRPLVTLSLAMNYAYGKGELREPHDPDGYHFVNLVIHTLVALVLFGLVRRTLWRVERFRDRSVLMAFAAALLWAVHPLTTQGVTYIIQRAESAMALFYLLTLYCTVRGVDSPARSRWWYAGAVASAGLGMGCKPVIVTVPVVLLAFDRIFLSRSFHETLSRRWGLYVGTVISLFVFSNGVFSKVLSTKAGTMSHVGFQYKGISPLDYLMVQPAALLRYLELSVWPTGLCLDYGWKEVTGFSEWGPQGLVILALLGLTVFGLWRRPKVAFLGLAFFVILAPTSSFIPIKDLIFEHRAYLPLAAVILVVLVVLDDVLHRISVAGPTRSITSACFVAIVVIALMFGTYQRNKAYSSDIDMWRSVVEASPENGRSYINLGLAISKLNERGRYQEALQYLEKACHYAPEYVIAWQFYGKALYKLGRYSEALEFLRTALAKEPKKVLRHARKRPAETRFLLGCALAQLNRLEEARSELERAVELDGDRSLYWENLGAIAGRQGDFQRSKEALLKATELAPLDAERPSDFNAITARCQLALTCQNLGQPGEELAYLKEASRLEPENLQPRLGLIARYLRTGDSDRALEELKFLRSRDPDHAMLKRPDAQELLSGE